MVSDSKWSCKGKSVIGALHEKKGLPNQDAIDWHPPESKENDLPLILAVSDGHGSSKHFRSNVGSQLAVEAAIKAIRENILDNKQFCEEYSPQHLKDLKEQVEGRLPQQIIMRWEELVKEDWKNKSTESKEGTYIQQKVEDKRLTAYGATLLCVVVTKHFVLYLQLGDGDILCVDSQGNTTRPIPKDKTLIANETYSLCQKDAWQYFRFKIENYSNKGLEEMPELILVSTDGYANSFSSEEGFISIGKDYRQLIIEQGLDKVVEQLPGFLEETSSKGSGDDISLGIITRINPQTSDNSKQQTETSESQEVDETSENQEDMESTNSTVDEKVENKEKESVSS